MPARLRALSIQGFRTIRRLDAFEPRSVNVLIGINGAGKSNLISFFRFLSWMMSGNVQEYVAVSGGANAILHDGSEHTPQIRADVRLETEKGENEYSFRLAYAAGDTLIFTEEKYRFSDATIQRKAPWIALGAGHREAGLTADAEKGNVTARTIQTLLQKCVLYQFHNTSLTARMRGKWNVDDSRWLKEDAANLAPFLLRLRDEAPEYYHRIVESTRAALPFFSDFELTPDAFGRILLQWRERGTDMVFGGAQASDGMLRTMALLALLSQPERDLPCVLVLDEPELGLHPFAVSVVAALIRSAAHQCQVIVATQSTNFLDQFEPEDIIVVERDGRESTFKRLNVDELAMWREEYSTSELWEKNVLGGRPK